MADLNVSKKSIGALFNEMQGKKFIIPDYQRPYKWDMEKCDILWNDIVTFYQADSKSGNDYFLGTIVSFENDEKDKEIIDGQQRITSFFLLLRAFYRKLEDMAEDKYVIGLKNQLAPKIWDTDAISQVVEDKTLIHINSLVATEKDNETFHKILESGKAGENASDNYSKNYNFFKMKCDEFAENEPMQWNELCITILNKCIILPIECDTQETALTIFSTLNDRGMPLSDSDIFKAKLYSRKDSKEAKKEFTDSWKDLTQICKEARLKIDDIFRFYSHVLRGRKEEKTKEIGLRKFYSENNSKRLFEDNLMSEIMELALFWRYVNNPYKKEVELTNKLSLDTKKFLHVLKGYPNDFWRYATSVFYITNKKQSNFNELFLPFVKELLSFLFVKFIDYPSVNGIKSTIYNSCISIIKENKLSYSVEFNEKYLSQEIEDFSSSRISRALLLLHAYLNPNQESLISNIFDIEHIFPKKWNNTNYEGWNKEDADLYLDRFGNKIIFEKRLNIQAGNNYFGHKKVKYSESKIASVIDLSNYHKNDWIKVDIEQREVEFKNDILTFFKSNLKLTG